MMKIAGELAVLAAATFFSYGVSLSQALAGQCVAHRGYSSRYLENSMESLRAAVAVGAKALEFDIVTTKDGHGVIHHDKTPARTMRSRNGKNCALHTLFRDQTLKELRDNCELVNGETLPLFTDVLEEFRYTEVTLFPEFKGISAEKVVNTLVAAEIQPDRLNRFVAISFKEENLNNLLSKGFRSPVLLLSGNPDTLVPDRFHGFGTKNLTRQQINDFHQRGMVTNIYTVNEEDKIRDFFQRGVDFVSSDEVELCLEVLDGLVP